MSAQPSDSGRSSDDGYVLPGRASAILVVDDERSILASLEDLFEDEYEVLTAASAEEALAILERERVMVILCDQRMPGMNGDEFLAKARERCSASRILITGYADLSAVVNAVNQGQIYAYVAKPWEPHQLRVLVTRAVEHAALAERYRHEKRLFDLFMEQSPDGVYFKDREHRFVRVNRQTLEILGVEDANELVGKSHADLGYTYGGSGDAIAEEQERIMATREPLLDSTRLVRLPSGAERWFSSSKVPVCDERGEVTGLLCIARDITERVRTETALRESEEHIRLLLDSTAEAIYGIDRRGRCTFCNRASLALLGYEKEADLLGRDMHELIHHTTAEGEALPGERCRIAEALRGASGVHAEDEVFWRADGTSFPVEYWSYPIREDGEVAGAVVTFLDVTERRRAEDAVRLVHRIASKIGRALDAKSAFEVALRLICLELGWDIGEAWQPREDGKLSLTAAWLRPGAPALRRFREASEDVRFPRGEGLPGEVWKTAKPVWFANASAAPREQFIRQDLARASQLGSACAIPVQAGGEVIAVLAFFMRRADEEGRGWMEAISAAAAPLGAFLDRIVAEQARLETETRLELALEGAGIGCWEWDLAPDRVRFDELTRSLLDRPAGEYETTGESFERLVHPEDLERVRGSWYDVLEREGRYALDYRVIRADGSVRFVEERARAVPKRGEGSRRVVGVLWDVTDAKLAEAEIRSLARFPEENPDPVLRLTREGVIETANKASAPLLEGWGTGVGAAVPEELRTLVEEVFPSAEPYETEVEAGDHIFRLTIVPIPEHGYVNIYGNDVTVQKRAEEKLRGAEKMEAIGQLTGGVAHDFNNRLTVIQGNLELLETRLRGGDQRLLSFVANARHATAAGAKLTRQLLAFSRRQVLEERAFVASEVVGAMEDMLRRTLGETVELRLELDPGGVVHTDPHQLEDALLNLAVNARHAMPGGGELVIEVRNTAIEETQAAHKAYLRPGEYVLIAVTDTGCGMPEEVRQRAFEPFFTTKERGTGTGLGLSMVYGFVKQSGGMVDIYSEEGQGTCIKLYLPRQGARAPEPKEPAAEVEAGDDSATVLLVEDDAGVRRVGVAILEDLGYRVIEADGPLQALSVIEAEADIDLLFTDMVMPDMGGLELAQSIRQSGRDLPVLFTSGYTEHGPFRDRKSDAAVHWITKPYTRETLKRKVREVLADPGPAAK